MRIKLFFIISLVCISAFPQTKKIKDLENRRKATLREIENTNKLLLETKRTSTGLLNRIKLISSQIDARRNVVSILNQEVASINNEQQKIQKEITELEKTLTEKQDRYAKAVRSMATRKQGQNKLLFVLSGKSISESMRRMRYLRDYSEWRNKEADEIKAKKEELGQKKLALEKTRLEKISLMSLKESEQQKLTNEENVHKTEITEIGKKEKGLQQLLAEKRKQANALNAQIERLIAEEVARQEREARRLAEAKAKKERERQEREKALAAAKRNDKVPSAPKQEPEQKKEDQKIIAAASPAPVTPENFNLSNSFAANKGRLPMPVTGTSTIVSRFGTHQYSQWITTNSNGIDIQAKASAEARSVFDGEVSRIVAFPGYNNCVIIRHGGYYTFYGNIQNVYVKQGDKVKTGQSIGRVYTEPETGNSQLHFQLWKGTTKMNPEPWLRR